MHIKVHGNETKANQQNHTAPQLIKSKEKSEKIFTKRKHTLSCYVLIFSIPFFSFNFPCFSTIRRMICLDFDVLFYVSPFPKCQ